MIIFYLGGLTFLIWAFWDLHKDEAFGFPSLNKWIEVENRLFDWMAANPDLEPAWFPNSRQMIYDCIAAYQNFLLRHPYIRDTSQLKWLESLLNAPDPSPPRKRFPIPLPCKKVGPLFYACSTGNTQF